MFFYIYDTLLQHEGNNDTESKRDRCIFIFLYKALSLYLFLYLSPPLHISFISLSLTKGYELI